MDGRFAAIADEFVARVRAAEIAPATEVVLVYELTDQSGNSVPAVRIPLEATITVNGLGVCPRNAL